MESSLLGVMFHKFCLADGDVTKKQQSAPVMFSAAGVENVGSLAQENLRRIVDIDESAPPCCIYGVRMA